MPLRDNDDPPLRRAPDQKRSQPAENRPADDLRVQPFTDDVFSEYHSRRKEAGAPFGLIAGVVIGVAAVAGIGWYLWNSGALGGGPADGVPQLVKAHPDPYKVKPENPGGMQVENQDKLVYDRVAKGEAPPRVENLLPAPEEPKAPPKPAAPPPEAAKPEPAPAEAANVETAKVEPPAPEPAKPAEAAKPEPAKEVAKTEPAKPAAPSKTEQDDLASLVAAATGGREAATGPINTGPINTKPGAAPAADAPASQTQVAAAPPISPAAPAAPLVTPPAVSPAAMAGAFQIQLASARSEQGAMGEWNRIVGKNKDALAGLTPNVARVDLGEKGVFFRLRAGPLKDKAAAESVCSTLGASNVGCIVVKP
jgi:hypothetical protein